MSKENSDGLAEGHAEHNNELYDVLAGGLLNLMEQIEQVNRTLAAIAEAMESISSRLNYATILDNQD